MALFVGQGFVAELIGFWCDRDSLSFPRRIFPGMGFPTIWRRKIPLRKISRMDALGERVILFYLSSTERVAVVFPNNRSRRQFMHFLSEALESRQLARRHSAAGRSHEAY